MSTYAHADDLPEAPDPKTLAAAELLHIPFSPHQPYLKQGRFLLDFSREALYGGAAGGGKSDALLMSALQFVDVPHYAAILFRKSYADLSQPGALMDRAREWFIPHKINGVRWSEIEHKWTFPSGATISFAYIDKQNDHLKYQGAEFQYIGFDELTQFKEKQYRYLFSRLRKTEDTAKEGTALSRVPLRMRAGTNPGGPGHHWVYLRFVKKWEEWQKHLAVYAQIPQAVRDAEHIVRPEQPRPYFHPSTIDDNPYLNTDEYGLSLENLDHVTRLQLRRGDWQIKPDGRMFKRTWFKIIGEAPSDTRWVRSWDLAATEEDPDIDPDYTAGCLIGMTPQGQIIIKHMVHIRVSDFEVESAVKQAAQIDGWDTPIIMEQEPGASGKTVVSHYRRVVLPGYTFTGKPSSGSKTTRAVPFAARAGAGDVALVAGVWTSDFLDEAEIFPDGEHDDMVDAASAGYLYLSGKMDGSGFAGDINIVSLEQEAPWAGTDLSGWDAA